ncbi:MAG: hypothetical protein ACLT14_11115, partial [Butyricicoccaceae bacterium]
CGIVVGCHVRSSGISDRYDGRGFVQHGPHSYHELCNGKERPYLQPFENNRDKGQRKRLGEPYHPQWHGISNQLLQRKQRWRGWIYLVQVGWGANQPARRHYKCGEIFHIFLGNLLVVFYLQRDLYPLLKSPPSATH